MGNYFAMNVYQKDIVGHFNSYFVKHNRTLDVQKIVHYNKSTETCTE